MGICYAIAMAFLAVILNFVNEWDTEAVVLKYTSLSNHLRAKTSFVFGLMVAIHVIYFILTMTVNSSEKLDRIIFNCYSRTL